MAAPRNITETPDALRAFEDYWDMGDARSLPKLAALYRSRSVAGEAVPTVREPTLKTWSAEHGWQQRCKDRIAEEAERVREENRKRVRAYRNRLMLAIEADTSLYAKRVSAGDAILAEDAASLERMTKLFFQLAEEPLAERHELTGAQGGPVQVEQRTTHITLTGDAALAVVQIHQEQADEAEATGAEERNGNDGDPEVV